MTGHWNRWNLCTAYDIKSIFKLIRISGNEQKKKLLFIRSKLEKVFSHLPFKVSHKSSTGWCWHCLFDNFPFARCRFINLTTKFCFLCRVLSWAQSRVLVLTAAKNGNNSCESEQKQSFFFHPGVILYHHTPQKNYCPFFRGTKLIWFHEIMNFSYDVWLMKRIIVWWLQFLWNYLQNCTIFFGTSIFFHTRVLLNFFYMAAKTNAMERFFIAVAQKEKKKQKCQIWHSESRAAAVNLWLISH